MTTAYAAFIKCDGPGCTESTQVLGSALTVEEARANARLMGYTRTNDDEDLCRTCTKIEFNRARARWREKAHDSQLLQVQQEA